MGLIVALSMSAFAQDCDRKERKAPCEALTEQLAKELSLNDEQAAQLKAADETFAQEAKAVREKQKQVMLAGRDAMKVAETRRDSTLKATLTKDQYVKYLELKVKRMEHRRAKGVKPMHHKGDRKMGERFRAHRADSVMGTPRRFEKR